MNLEPWTTVSAGANPFVVRCVQYLLKAKGQSLAVDGSYGPKTKSAVQAFQSSQGLTADGTVGPQTWRKLVVTIQRGSTGDAVRALQALGLVYIPEEPPLAVDGQFGSQTEERVRGLQSLYGLVEDGIVGPQTWSFATARNPWPLVRVGATADTSPVLAVQFLLRAHGATIAADGSYGPKTGAAMRAFQQTLRSDDLGTTCGQLDWPALVVTVRRGDSGDAVSAVQSLLPLVTTDGNFGPQTEQAVRDLQEMFGAAADGVVGPKTWELLVKPKFD